MSINQADRWRWRSIGRPGAAGLVVAIVVATAMTILVAPDSARAALFEINFSCTSGCVDGLNEPIGMLEVADIDLGVPNAVVDIQSIRVSAFGLEWTELDASLGTPVLHLDAAGDAYAVRWQSFTMGFARFDLDADPRSWFCDFACSTIQPNAAGTYTLSPAIPEPSAAIVFAAGLLTVARVTRRRRAV